MIIQLTCYYSRSKLLVPGSHNVRKLRFLRRTNRNSTGISKRDIYDILPPNEMNTSIRFRYAHKLVHFCI